MKAIRDMAALMALASMGAVMVVRDDDDPKGIDPIGDDVMRRRGQAMFSTARREAKEPTTFDTARLERAAQKRARRAAAREAQPNTGRRDRSSGTGPGRDQETALNHQEGEP